MHEVSQARIADHGISAPREMGVGDQDRAIARLR
jgi:hypothetical protein